MGDEQWKGWWGDDPPFHHPLLLGRGERLFDHLDGGTVGYRCAEFVSSPAVLHARLVRTEP